MALERSRLQGEELVGLIGELLLMRALIETTPVNPWKIIDSWHGFERSSRDFQIGTVGVEVKTTRGTTSTHRVQGVHQVEIGHAVGGSFESAFYLVSIGIEAVDQEEPQENTWTLPQMVENLLCCIEGSDLLEQESRSLREKLLESIRKYGSTHGFGYDHLEMKHQIIFGSRWRTAFVRGFDMTDLAIAVPRSDDLTPFSMIDPSSLEFTVVLPAQVRGDTNPINGLTQTAIELMGRAASLDAPEVA
jgi:hypothetical protein